LCPAVVRGEVGRRRNDTLGYLITPRTWNTIRVEETGWFFVTRNLIN
jgi:hypothetical protein